MPSRGFTFLVLIPFGVAFFYQMFFASRIYESETRFIVKHTGAESTELQLGVNLLSGSSSSSGEDLVLVQNYIHSQNLADLLHQKLDLRSHFQKFGSDFLRYFPENASKEQFLKYYLKTIIIKIDPDKKVGILSVRAYDAAFANKVSSAIVSACESFINGISLELAREQVAFVETEVSTAKEKLSFVRQKLLKFQNFQSLLDPEVISESELSIISELEQKLVQAKTELIRLLSFMTTDSPEVIALQQQLQALEEQIGSQRSRLTGLGDETFNYKLAQFKELQFEVEFALEAYKSACLSLEKARLDASRKLKHLVIISRTGLPETPAYPRILYNSVTSMVVLLLFYGVIRLVFATIQDHRI